MKVAWMARPAPCTEVLQLGSHVAPSMCPVRKSRASHHTNGWKQVALHSPHSLPCCGLSSPFLSPRPHPREGGWASPLNKQMANQCEKVPKTNLTSRRRALGAVFTYGGKTHGICPHPAVLLVSFSVLSSLPGLIYFLNEVGWFLINPEGLSWSSFISLSVTYLCPQL